MSFGVVCGVLWIVAGGVSFCASRNEKKMWVLMSASIYLVGYMIFIALFGAVIVHIGWYNHGFNWECPEVKKKFRRSGDEFIGYSICAFFLIGTSIIFTLASLVSI